MIPTAATHRVVIHDAVNRRWLRFCQPRRTIEAWAVEEVVDCLRRLERAVESETLWAAGFLSYEAAPAFDRALSVRGGSQVPLLWFGLYDRPEVIELPRARGETSECFGGWTPSVARTEYEDAVEELRACIARGETYQVNYTLRLRAPWGTRQASGEEEEAACLWELFLRLVEAQRPAYAALIDTPRLAICSASPELFFRRGGDRVLTRPMKGTAPRGLSHADDVERAGALVASEKDRAENAMIVDMMRNDLGRVARTGSVRVRDLFRVERYPTLWQMTSAVEAETSAPLAEIFTALFPCASITGAPKPNTMRIIARMETEPRGIYTGAIGMIAPERQAQFNVAIRTLVVDKDRREAEFGVGGGVVWDSTPGGEYRECLLKARILTERRPEFSLLETLLCRGAGVQRGIGFQPVDSGVAGIQPPDMETYFLLHEHLCRLRASAEYFGIPLDENRVRQELSSLAAALPPCAHRVRLLVSRTGEVACEARPICGLEDAAPVRLELAARAVDSNDPFLYHKTTRRAVYDAARAGAARGDDVLLYNERGEITETCIANVVARMEGTFWTPPVRCGLLPGVFRARLLAEGQIGERTLTLDMLGAIDELFLINSVRQWRRAALLV